jgi:uncharacterized membrane protein YfcA
MEWWLAYFAVGAAAGFFAGMFGIGGGAIIVPLLATLFAAQGMAKAHIVHLAVGTGMATILFTSVASMRAHAVRGAVRWDIAWRMTPGVLAGGLLGSGMSGFIPAKVFAALFALVIIAAGTGMLLDFKPGPSRRPPGLAGLSAAGFLISGLSAFAAVGGAFLTVPLLLWCNVPLLSAIGTAAAIGFPIALAGTIGYVAAGFVFWPALVGVVLGSILTAPLGAMTAHRLPTKWLKRIAALLFYAIATRMLLSF